MKDARKMAEAEIVKAVEVIQSNNQLGYTAVTYKALNTLQKAGFRNVHRKTAFKELFAISSHEERLRYIQDHVSISKKQIVNIVTVTPRAPYPRPRKPKKPKGPIEPFIPKDFDFDLD
jgi:hypothetical protein